MPYKRVNLRISREAKARYLKAAQEFGWRLSDFFRALLSIGVAISFLTASRPEQREAAIRLLGGIKPLTPSGGFGYRPYAPRWRGRESTWVTLNLPESIRDLVAIYAKMYHASPNEAYNKLLATGLVVYLKAQTCLLEVAKKAPTDEQEASSGKGTVAKA